MTSNCVCHGRYDHPHILAGQGTIGLEILEQVQDVDAIVVPVGGAGLIAGVALAVKSLHPQIQIIVSNIPCPDGKFLPEFVRIPFTTCYPICFYSLCFALSQQ